MFTVIDFHPINPIQVFWPYKYMPNSWSSPSLLCGWENQFRAGRKKKKKKKRERETERDADSSDCTTSEAPLETHFYQVSLTEVAKSLNAPPDLSNSHAQEAPPEWDAPFLWSLALISSVHMKTAKIAVPLIQKQAKSSTDEAQGWTND